MQLSLLILPIFHDSRAMLQTRLRPRTSLKLLHNLSRNSASNHARFPWIKSAAEITGLSGPDYEKVKSDPMRLQPLLKEHFFRNLKEQKLSQYAYDKYYSSINYEVNYPIPPPPELELREEFAVNPTKVAETFMNIPRLALPSTTPKTAIIGTVNSNLLEISKSPVVSADRVKIEVEEMENGEILDFLNKFVIDCSGSSSDQVDIERLLEAIIDFTYTTEEELHGCTKLEAEVGAVLQRSAWEYFKTIERYITKRDKAAQVKLFSMSSHGVTLLQNYSATGYAELNADSKFLQTMKVSPDFAVFETKKSVNPHSVPLLKLCEGKLIIPIELKKANLLKVDQATFNSIIQQTFYQVLGLNANQSTPDIDSVLVMDGACGLWYVQFQSFEEENSFQDGHKTSHTLGVKVKKLYVGDLSNTVSEQMLILYAISRNLMIIKGDTRLKVNAHKMSDIRENALKLSKNYIRKRITQLFIELFRDADKLPQIGVSAKTVILEEDEVYLFASSLKPSSPYQILKLKWETFKNSGLYSDTCSLDNNHIRSEGYERSLLESSKDNLFENILKSIQIRYQGVEASYVDVIIFDPLWATLDDIASFFPSGNFVSQDNLDFETLKLKLRREASIGNVSVLKEYNEYLAENVISDTMKVLGQGDLKVMDKNGHILSRGLYAIPNYTDDNPQNPNHDEDNLTSGYARIYPNWLADL